MIEIVSCDQVVCAQTAVIPVSVPIMISLHSVLSIIILRLNPVLWSGFLQRNSKGDRILHNSGQRSSFWYAAKHTYTYGLPEFPPFTITWLYIIMDLLGIFCMSPFPYLTIWSSFCNILGIASWHIRRADTTCIGSLSLVLFYHFTTYLAILVPNP